MSISLYEMTQTLNRLLMLDDMDGAVDTETGEFFSKEALDQLEMDRKEKIEGCLLFVKNEEAMVSAIDAEIEALKKRKESHQKLVDRTWSYVQENLNGETFETAKVGIKYRTSKRAELVGDIDDVPEEYLRYKPAPPPELNKALVKKVFAAGGRVRGCRVVETVNMNWK